MPAGETYSWSVGGRAPTPPPWGAAPSARSYVPRSETGIRDRRRVPAETIAIGGRRASRLAFRRSAHELVREVIDTWEEVGYADVVDPAPRLVEAMEAVVAVSRRAGADLHERLVAVDVR